MEPEVFQLLPVNSESFQELLKKSAIILNICENLKIIPIVYGSFACFYHTQDENMPVNDLDLLVPEDSFPELINILKKNNIIHKEMTWTSIVCTIDNSKIELDSIERNLGIRSKETIYIQVGDSGFNIINRISLTDIYQEAVDRMPETQEFAKQKALYKGKLDKLKNITLS